MIFNKDYMYMGAGGARTFLPIFAVANNPGNKTPNNGVINRDYSSNKVNLFTFANRGRTSPSTITYTSFISGGSNSVTFPSSATTPQVEYTENLDFDGRLTIRGSASSPRTGGFSLVTPFSNGLPYAILGRTTTSSDDSEGSTYSAPFWYGRDARQSAGEYTITLEAGNYYMCLASSSLNFSSKATLKSFTIDGSLKTFTTNFEIYEIEKQNSFNVTVGNKYDISGGSALVIWKK